MTNEQLIILYFQEEDKGKEALLFQELVKRNINMFSLSVEDDNELEHIDIYESHIDIITD